MTLERIPGAEHIKNKIPHTERLLFHLFEVPKAPKQKLDEKLAYFLKKTRGETSFAEFSKRTGLTPSTLHRLENCQQSITLGRLEQVMDRLKVTLWDVFGD